MKAYRASLLYFGGTDAAAGEARFEQDGLLVIGPDEAGTQVVQAIGSYQSLHHSYPDIAVEHFPGRLIAPGFVDMHLHYPQLDVIDSPADGLLPWLENYTFPCSHRISCAGSYVFHSGAAAERLCHVSPRRETGWRHPLQNLSRI